MVVRLRLARHGTRNNPFYHVVVIRDSKARDARPIEKVGEYDPIPRVQSASKLPNPLLQSFAGSSQSAAAKKMASNAPGHGSLMTSGLPPSNPADMGVYKPTKRLEWNESRIKYWLSVGVQPSKPVARLLDRAGLVPPGVHYKGIYRPPQNNYPAPNIDTQPQVQVQPPSSPNASENEAPPKP